jgi:hypothetical protein
MKAYRGSSGIIPLILKPGIRLSSKWYAAAAFHPGNSPVNHVFFSRITMFYACLLL